MSRILAETISLLHDVGKIENSGNTARTMMLYWNQPAGLSLNDKKILDCLMKKKKIIETATGCMARRLPKELESKTGFFAKLIRDIDKLDIYYVLVSRLEIFSRSAEGAWRLGLFAKEGIQNSVVQAVMENRTMITRYQINHHMIYDARWVEI